MPQDPEQFKDGVTPCGACGAEWLPEPDGLTGYLQHTYDCAYQAAADKEAQERNERDVQTE